MQLAEGHAEMHIADRHSKVQPGERHSKMQPAERYSEMQPAERHSRMQPGERERNGLVNPEMASGTAVAGSMPACCRTGCSSQTSMQLGERHFRMQPAERHCRLQPAENADAALTVAKQNVLWNLYPALVLHTGRTE